MFSIAKFSQVISNSAWSFIRQVSMVTNKQSS